MMIVGVVSLQLLLGDNKLSGGDTIQHVVSCCPQLHSLSLVGNRFASLDDLKQLVSASPIMLLYVTLYHYSLH